MDHFQEKVELKVGTTTSRIGEASQTHLRLTGHSASSSGGWHRHRANLGLDSTTLSTFRVIGGTVLDGDLLAAMEQEVRHDGLAILEYQGIKQTAFEATARR